LSSGPAFLEATAALELRRRGQRVALLDPGLAGAPLAGARMCFYCVFVVRFSS
jgi:hypothetical protein